MCPWSTRRSPRCWDRRAAGIGARRNRVHRGSAAVALRAPPPPPVDVPWRLGLSSAGTFENLRSEPVPNAERDQPGRARAARALAADFRDIMVMPGMFTDDARSAARARRGGRVGPGVTEFAVGDWLYGFFPEGSGTLVPADTRPVVPSPRTGLTPSRCQIQSFSSSPKWRSWTWPTPRRASGCLCRRRRRCGDGRVQLGRHPGLEVFATASRGKSVRRGPWVLTTIISRICVAGVRGEVPHRHRWPGHGYRLGLTAGEFVDASLRLVAPGGVFLRWARPTSGTPCGRPGLPGCALPRVRPLRAGPSPDAPVLLALAALFDAGACIRCRSPRSTSGGRGRRCAT